MSMSLLRKTLIGLALFNAVSAIGGGIGIIATNGLGMPLTWLAHTPFADYAVPGYILIIVVGGSAVVAAVLLFTRQQWSAIMACGAGAIMTGWILGEVVFIRQATWLQALYLLTGLAMMGLGAVLETIYYQRKQHILPLRS